MGLQNSLLNQASLIGKLPKKQLLAENTPMQIFIQPIIKEAMQRKIAMLQQMQSQVPQMNMQQSPMIEPPSINPLQNRLMSEAQGGTGGGLSKPQGGMPNAAG